MTALYREESAAEKALTPNIWSCEYNQVPGGPIQDLHFHVIECIIDGLGPRAANPNIGDSMKNSLKLLLVLSTCAAHSALAQRGPVARTDVYHVHFAKAAPGKAAPLGDSLKTQDPKAPMKGHLLVLRHQDGDDWDYAVIELPPPFLG